MSPRNHQRLGMTLVELIVTIAIMSVIITGAFQVFHEGLQLFQTNLAASEAQSSVITSLGRISAEVVNTREELVRTYESPDIPGLIFASPLDSSGAVQFHPETGRIFWQKYVCFYYIEDPDTAANGKLYRSERVIPDEAGASTIGRTGSTSVATVRAGLSTLSPGDFTSGAGLELRLLGSSISGFTVKQFDGEVEDETGASKQVLGGTGVARDFAIDIILEAGDKSSQSRDGYYIRVDSRVAPRS